MLNPNAPYESFQKRRRDGELLTPPLDQSNRVRYFPGIPARVIREAVLLSRPVGIDKESWDALRLQRKLEG